MLCWILGGCGGSSSSSAGSSGGSLTATSASSGNNAPTAPSPTSGGTVVITHLLGASKTANDTTTTASIGTVPPSATQFVFTGFDINGETRFSPRVLNRAPLHRLSNVAPTVSRMHIDYVDAKGVIQVMADVPVKVINGIETRATASNLVPPWNNVAVTAPPAYGRLSSPQTTAIASPSPAAPGPPFTMQIVNDSGQPDASTFVLLAGANISVNAGSGQLATSSAGSGNVTAKALNLLPTSGSIVSKYTGMTRPVYNFQLSTVSSGELLVSYGSAVHSNNGGLPSVTNTTDPDFKTRWDHMELTIPGQLDLTSINAYAIPMQIDFIDGNGVTLQSSTLSYYGSTATILQALNNLSTGMGSAFYNTSGTTGFNSQWVSSPPNLSTFVRVVGPNGILTPTQQSPAPYPSFQQYLNSLSPTTGAPTFTVQGSGGAGNGLLPAEYTYSGTLASDNAGGYKITLTGTMTTSPAPPYGPPSGINTSNATSVLPANLSVTLNLPSGSFDYNIYAVPSTAFTVNDPPAQTCSLTAGSPTTTVSSTLAASLIAGMTVTGTGVPAGTTVSQVNGTTVTMSANATISGSSSLSFSASPFSAYFGNSTYANIAGDYFAALNNGYLNGNWGNGAKFADGTIPVNGQSPWYNNPPVPYPFGAARPTNDGFYNPYASVFYNLSDAYAFVYGDRNGRPSPAVYPPASTSTIRITLLNDGRLDAPLVKATVASSSEIDLSWQAVPNALAYSVEVTPPYNILPTVVQTNSLAVTGLTAGQSYTFKVRATATVTPSPSPGASPSPVPVQSYAIPVYATTTGTFAGVPAPSPSPASSPAINYQIAVGGWSGGTFPITLPSSWTFLIGGQSNTGAFGSPGNPNASVTGYAGNNYLPLIVKDTSSNIAFQGLYSIYLTGNGNAYTVGPLFLTEELVALTLSTQITPPYSNGAGNQCVVGTPLNMQPDKRFQATVFPSPSP